MGVKGLQFFMEKCCPKCCVPVDLKEMARQHVARHQHGASTTASISSLPTLVVDGMGCISYWYTCRDWVCGGQWKEYMAYLERWIEAFTSAGIRLVFFFDGVVEEEKRQEWAKRRRNTYREIFKVFHHIKVHGEQPPKGHGCLPSGLASFSRFALRSLGQEVFCSVQNADYEIASYARRHGSMGILGQDTDFIIYDSAPYLSAAKLRLSDLTTILYDRNMLCQAVGLTAAQLPLLACLLGNDVVAEARMQHIRNNALATYRRIHPPSQGEKVLAVAQLVSSVWGREEAETGLIPRSLVLSDPDRKNLEVGLHSYFLSEQDHLLNSSHGSGYVMQKYVSPEIIKACREQHVSAQGFIVYNILCEGVVECSNTVEDEEDEELSPQALVYKTCRQHIYSLLLRAHGTDTHTPQALVYKTCRQHIYSLLLRAHDGNRDVPVVKEWFASPGNPLKEADLVCPVTPPSGEQPSLELLWFSSGPEVSALRLKAFLSVFDCQEFLELHGSIEDHLLVTLCLVTYIVLQVRQLSIEDVDAYLSQAVCLRLQSPQELDCIKLHVLSSRAVQLGHLYVRGLANLLGANCAAGFPLPIHAMMPWHSFDGRLYHAKYLQAHSGATPETIVGNDSSCQSLFLHLKEQLLEVCRKRGRTLQSTPRPPGPPLSCRDGSRAGSNAHSGRSRGGRGGWRESDGDWRRDRQEDSRGSWRHGGGTRGDHQQHSGGSSWRDMGGTRGGGEPRGFHNQGRARGGGGGRQGEEMRGEGDEHYQAGTPHPHGMSWNSNHPPAHSSRHPNRGRY